METTRQAFWNLPPKTSFTFLVVSNPFSRGPHEGPANLEALHPELYTSQYKPNRAPKSDPKPLKPVYSIATPHEQFARCAGVFGHSGSYARQEKNHGRNQNLDRMC